ncbi:hypothetical protein RvY_11705 [Ramazzottius varieornatus]|uniref:BTB domain-containing protein n=1 Tax=Ramazzottius varieornatus TaxID=947166 RepID=A0A1D1VLB8_RAMVA|nr:hypothetical protein RvY_11705 [Ramazzottius varieornatus]
MLELNLGRCKTGRCLISDVSAGTLDAVLMLLYFGCVKYPSELAGDLLVAANKYDLLFLKQHCENTLIADIGLVNVADLLCLADSIDAKDLKKATLDYLAANSAQALTFGKIDGILKNGNLNLIKEVFAAALKVDLTEK